MRKFIKYILLFSFALALQNQFFGNFVFSQNLFTIIKVAVILSIFELLLKPIIKILLLPINLLTLGLFRIVINTVGFYLAVFLISDFQLHDIHTLAFIWQGITFPALNFSGFWAFVVNSTSENLILFIFRSILKTKKDKK